MSLTETIGAIVKASRSHPLAKQQFEALLCLDRNGLPKDRGWYGKSSDEWGEARLTSLADRLCEDLKFKSDDAGEQFKKGVRDLFVQALTTRSIAQLDSGIDEAGAKQFFSEWKKELKDVKTRFAQLADDHLVPQKNESPSQIGRGLSDLPKLLAKKPAEVVRIYT